MAARLAEDSTISVAVVEGGGFYEIDNGNISQIPAFAVEYSSASPSTVQPAVDWGIITVPQIVSYCLVSGETSLHLRLMMLFSN